MSKKINIFQKPKKKEEDKGFEDLIEGFLTNGEEGDLKNKISKDKNFDSYKNFNHLELEKERLQKLSSMLSKKIPNVIEHNLTENIIDKFTTYNYNLRDQVTIELMLFDSHFNKNLRLLYNKAFRKK